MRVVLLGRKAAATEVLRSCTRRGFDVAAVVPPDDEAVSSLGGPRLGDVGRELGVPVATLAEVYAAIGGHGAAIDLADIDVVVSFLFPKIIDRRLIDLPSIGAFNFHPGPLPEFRGRRGYNFAILEEVPEYGASLHWIDEGVDTGDLVDVRRFPIDPAETALSLERRTTACLLEMCEDFLDLVTSGEPIPRTPQGEGRSATKAEMLAGAAVQADDTPELVRRRARAYWYPPHPGAYVVIGGERFTIVDDETLLRLGRELHERDG